MTVTQYKRLTITLTIAVIVLIALSTFLFWKHSWQHIEVVFASEQTKIFEEMRARALESDPAAAAGYLEYAVRYYPTGSKQRTGSRLDIMVERERATAVRDIITYLRVKSGQDLGTSAEKWIERFAKR